MGPSHISMQPPPGAAGSAALLRLPSSPCPSCCCFRGNTPATKVAGCSRRLAPTLPLAVMPLRRSSAGECSVPQLLTRHLAAMRSLTGGVLPSFTLEAGLPTTARMPSACSLRWWWRWGGLPCVGGFSWEGEAAAEVRMRSAYTPVMTLALAVTASARKVLFTSYSSIVSFSVRFTSAPQQCKGL